MHHALRDRHVTVARMEMSRRKPRLTRSTGVTRELADRDDNQRKSTDSFGRDDLLVLAKVADLSHTWIH